MIDIHAYGVGLNIIRHDSEPPPPVGSIAQLVATMTPGEWRELVTSNIDPVLSVGNPIGGTAGNRMAGYAVSTARSLGRIIFAGCDHQVPFGVPGAHAVVDYLDSSNAWRTLFYTSDPGDPARSLGSHAYQKGCADPETGDFYLYSVSVIDATTSPRLTRSDIFLSRGGTQPLTRFAIVPENLTQIEGTPALVWWRGPFSGSTGRGVIVVCGGNQGSVHALDPFAADGPAWIMSKLRQVPGQLGTIHNVAGYSGTLNACVFGGGNNIKALRRLNADQSVSVMPDAPWPVGAHGGGNFVGDGAGKFLAVGNVRRALPQTASDPPQLPNEAWLLDAAGAGSWTRVAAPPGGLVLPHQGQSVIACDLYDVGAAAYIDYRGDRSPKSQILIRKA